MDTSVLSFMVVVLVCKGVIFELVGVEFMGVGEWVGGGCVKSF